MRTVLPLILCLAGPAAAQEVVLPEIYDPMLYRDAEAVAAGAVLYGEHCASCHGADLEGEARWQIPDAETGLRGAPPHDETGHTWHHTDLQNFATTKYGIEALYGTRSAMVGFGEALTDEEILKVLAYIKSRWPEEILQMHDAMNAERQ